MSDQNFIQRFFNRSPRKKNYSKRSGFDVVLEALKFNRKSADGTVTVSSSMQVAAVWACVSLISETIGKLPLFIYEDVKGEKTRAKDHYLYPLLHDSPNPTMTAIEFRAMMQASLLLWGNAYAQIIYDQRGHVVELWPLLPGRMEQVQVKNGEKIFKYRKDNGVLETLDTSTIWHLSGLGFDGVIGHSIIWMARKAIALSMDAEEFAIRFFSNDARPGIVVEHPATLSDPAYARLKSDLDEEHTGLENSHRPMILEEGMKLHEIGIPPEDAQFLETRKFQVREIARWFGVPPHKIGDLEQATFSNIEHQSIEFVQDAIHHWLVRWEQSIRLNLLLPSERNRYYAEHLIDGLLRGDTKSRYEAYGVGKQWGWLTTNDIRRMENMNALPDGDRVMVPVNYTYPELIVKTVGMAKQTNALDMVDESDNALDVIAEKRLNDSIQVLFGDVMARVIKREGQDLRALAKKIMASNSDESIRSFLNAVKVFYQAEHCTWMKKQIEPVVRSFFILKGENPQEKNREIESFCDSFVRTYQERALEEIKDGLAYYLAQYADSVRAFDVIVDGWKDSRVQIHAARNTQNEIGLSCQ